MNERVKLLFKSINKTLEKTIKSHCEFICESQHDLVCEMVYVTI